MRKLEGGPVGDVADGLGSGHNLRIGCHHPRHICPDFEDAGVAPHRKKRSSIVRPSPAKSHSTALHIRGDEARQDKQGGYRVVFQHPGHVGICLGGIHDIYPVPFLRPDYRTGIYPFGSDSDGCQLGSDYPGGYQLSAALDCVQARLAELTEKADTLRYPPERIEDAVAYLQALLMLLKRKKFPDDGMMSLLVLVDDGPVVLIPGCRHIANLYQRVCKSAYGRAHQYGTVPFYGPGHYIRHFGHVGGIRH